MILGTPEDHLKERSSMRTPSGIMGDSTNVYASSSYSRPTSKSDRKPPRDVYAEHQAPQLSEAQIIANLEYALVGETTELFSYTAEGVKIPSNIDLNISQHLHDFIEPACIFRGLRQIIENKSQMTSMVKLGLVCAIERQLTSYQEAINEEFQNFELRLCDLYAFLRPKIDALRFLWFLACNLNMDPDALLSLVYKFIGGDKALEQLALQILPEMAQPFHELMCSWLQTGSLQVDAAIEEGFFVSSSSTSSRSRNVTAGDAQFIPEKVPAFLSRDIAKQIYEIGKTLNYLLLTCHQKSQVHTFSQEFRKSGLNQSVNTVFTESFQHEIRRLHKKVMAYLNYIIHNNLDLVGELRVLRDIMLMGKGDFIENLVIGSNDILSRPSFSIHPQQLSSLLQNSMRQTSIRGFSDSYKNRIDAILFDQENGKIGWDLYTLDFKVKEELDLVICMGKRSAKEYLRMFNFLLQLHRCSYQLSTSFRKSSLCRKRLPRRLLTDIRRIQRSLRSDPFFSMSILDKQCIWIVENLKKFDASRNLMLSLIGQLCLFFDEDIITPGFDKLMRNLNDSHSLLKGSGTEKALPLSPLALQRIVANPQNIEEEQSDYNMLTLDELGTLHQTYITSISRHTLLQHTSKSAVGKVSGVFYFQHIQNLIQIVLQFCDLDKEFFDGISDLISTIQLRTVGTIDESLSLYHSNLEEDLEKIAISRTELSTAFEHTRGEIVEDLKADSDVRLQLLGCRL
ncbi:unnamed protein product [Kuraishia capsulata CBS 1993]|uniref:Spindle pole body component n=1 Tax=Kuraishia capsulata CBS 1993 TaxID=1382522 RepID=W6MQX2_9ASCO|nr:uncharacterized protein KUCA_T00000240001 [Kuraishia capsulata CBS 1993]CDK24280.1 unnamed protein product [Kuraishia capsulata CBS 1993]